MREDMARRATPIPKTRASVITAIGATVATLYFAQEVLIPLALAVLLAFLLAPLTTRIERWRVGPVQLGRIPSVLLVATAAFGLIFGLGWVVGREVVRLAENLSTYQEEIVRKAEAFRSKPGGFGDKIKVLEAEIDKATAQPAATQPAATQPAATQPTATAPATRPGVMAAAIEQFGRNPIGAAAREAVGGPPTSAPSAPGSSLANPLFTVNIDAPASPLRTLATYLGLVLGPLGTGGLVIVFVIFMLVEREDLRDRVIRLVSRGKYLVTTRALNDAATRISRYMLAQSIVNGSYGLCVAVGLWLVGQLMGGGTSFPNFLLWGVLCAVFRFVPYVGPWIAAAFPIAISLAVYPGYGVFAAVAGAFVVFELLSNNVMEPWLYGASTGISTMAILVAAVFWTWLWGPVGLLLSTPLTVCIVVLGKHVAQLKFFDVLLGDQPALPPAVSYYQRLLAKDRTEAAEVVAEHAAANGVDNLPDDVLIPALVLARRDRQDGDLTADDETFIFDTTKDVIERLADEPAAGTPVSGAVAPARAGAAGETPPADPAPPPPLILGCPSHHRTEELALGMLGLITSPLGYRVEGVSTRALPAEIESTIDRTAPAAVFIAVFPPGGLPQASYLCRRLRKRFPGLKIIVGYWGRTKNFDRLLVRLRGAGASYVTTSMLQTRTQLKAVLAAMPVPPAPVPDPAYVPGPKFVDRLAGT
jgi:predicted PurR-regulated permease PerM